MRTQRESLEYKTWHHPTTSSTHASSKQQTEQKCKLNPQQTGLPSHSALPIRGKPNKQKKHSTDLTLYKAYTNHWTKLRRAETERKKEFNLEAWKEETSNTISFKKITVLDILKIKSPYNT